MIYFRDNNGNEQLIAGIAGADQTITQSITNGVTDKAPSSDAVYDAITPQAVSLTAETGYTISIETKCFKVGKLCTLSFIITGPMSGYAKLATGLPIPVTANSNYVVNFPATVIITGTGGSGREIAAEGYITAETALYLRGYNDVSGTGTMYGSVTYACE